MKLVTRMVIAAALLSAPMVTLAVAKGDNDRQMTGAGFVLYVSLNRP